MFQTVVWGLPAGWAGYGESSMPFTRWPSKRRGACGRRGQLHLDSMLPGTTERRRDVAVKNWEVE